VSIKFPVSTNTYESLQITTHEKEIFSDNNKMLVSEEILHLWENGVSQDDI